ncbi:MAG: MBL fold metallo-hydrolase [Pseudoflavonifractor sp.]|nr:MBL fold metallo-hydrolase [Alloprevotella sp.]MCM1116797.1 MBL fold metallo-hydrolase [Pseudoflavonifractor sp.]
MPNARLTFLGTGTSTGVPQIGCSCAVCRSRDRRDRRLRCAVLLEAHGLTILIDAGPDLRQQLLRHHPKKIDAVLITHSHYDHVGGLDDLRPYCFTLDQGLPLVCSPDVEADLRARIPYCFRQLPSPRVPRFCPVAASPGSPLNIGPISITPLDILHSDDYHILGFRIGSFAYVTDCKLMPHETILALHGVDTLVINALRHTPHPTHMNLREALDVIKATAPRRALITHMSHGIGLHSETSRLLPDGVELATDGLAVDLNI